MDRDYQEVITFAFVSSAMEAALRIDANPIKVQNPIAAHLDVMRTTLLGGLIDVLRTNVNRRQQRVRIFESARCFFRAGDKFAQPQRIAGLAFGPALPEQWDSGKRGVDFFDVKGDVEALAAPLRLVTEAASHPALHPGRSARVLIEGKPSGWIGELHPRLLREFELPHAPTVFELELDPLLQTPLPAAQAISRLPIVRRDLAVVVDESVPAQQLIDVLLAEKASHVEYIGLFDVYRGPNLGPGKKSLAILVLMQDTERTLTDAEIDATVADMLRHLKNRFQATLRQ